MKLDVREKGTITILEMAGKMMAGAGDILLRTRFKALLEQGKRQFVFDMTAVPFLDSSSLGEVVACHKRATEAEASITLVLSPRVRGLFELYRLKKVLPVFQNVRAAMASLRKGTEAPGP